TRRPAGDERQRYGDGHGDAEKAPDGTPHMSLPPHFAPDVVRPGLAWRRVDECNEAGRFVRCPARVRGVKRGPSTLRRRVILRPEIRARGAADWAVQRRGE